MCIHLTIFLVDSIHSPDNILIFNSITMDCQCLTYKPIWSYDMILYFSIQEILRHIVLNLID